MREWNGRLDTEKERKEKKKRKEKESEAAYRVIMNQHGQPWRNLMLSLRPHRTFLKTSQSSDAVLFRHMTCTDEKFFSSEERGSESVMQLV